MMDLGIFIHLSQIPLHQGEPNPGRHSLSQVLLALPDVSEDIPEVHAGIVPTTLQHSMKMQGDGSDVP